ncbi:hypothetical protein [Streptomyces griseocarneus]|uniref:hypothetical protein n=1 Tax=Streptomyces griseocarneus TaxID=51201 RepID=UPI001CCB4706|nr:hypothetical protein [Streptomyces griseocarneus]MBZ6476191.1 hypothetical protein [Streptomyces griseocarneus]
MTKDQVGRLIGASFGLFFIQANAGTLPMAVAVPLRIAAIAAFLGLVVFGRRRGGGTGSSGDATPGASFGRRYWYVVAAEVLGLAAGLLVISRVLHTPRAAVGWIAFVVGVHFFGLAVAWGRPGLRVLGGSMAACGAAALVLAACGASAAVIGVVAGILPGTLLLASIWWSGRTSAPASAAPERTAA